MEAEKSLVRHYPYFVMSCQIVAASFFPCFMGFFKRLEFLAIWAILLQPLK
jgi:hypothetical protein